MKEREYTWEGVQEAINSIAMQMFKDEWRPDYIVGITRGGLVPAVLLSHKTEIPMQTLCVQLKSEGLEENTESNCWMSEDAFGYEGYKIRNYQEDIQASANEPIEVIPWSGKNILIIDDINRGGDALSWIMQDWQAGCLPQHEHWKNVWHGNVRFASLVDNPNSKVPMDYCAEEFDMDEEDIWVSFPWES